MTKEDIKKRIQDIKDDAGDDERQHSREDDLRRDFIRFVQKDSKKYGELAALVLSTDALGFARHYA